ncbi:class I mannose-6-phosphate isomerase [Deinococcus sp.]|uniref:class I mannose-6-phosphate isomerase n=1 Tax=Deinococcus sp. TaxID=47478 RepID=UPI003C7D7DBB
MTEPLPSSPPPGLPNYDKAPLVQVAASSEGRAWRGWPAVLSTLRQAAQAASPQGVPPLVVLDCYPGVDLDELEDAARAEWPDVQVFRAESACRDLEALNARLKDDLTDDRVFGVLSTQTLGDVYDPARTAVLRAEVQAARQQAGGVLLLGTGAARVASGLPGALLVLADLPRWERQLRLRRGASNWLTHNPDEDMLHKYKRAYFWEWRVADRHKSGLFATLDFLLDTTVPHDPRLLTGSALREGLAHACTRPFRLLPFFDPGVWGGQWMKQRFDLPAEAPNYAWGFDCVPEENSLRLGYGEIVAEIPSLNLVLQHPRELLGEGVYARFGPEFPIRFDFLDTIGGQNLSLQVHPLTGYIQQHFGMHYTQDESYYILDAEPGACVYLGVKTGVQQAELMAELEAAGRGERPFEAERFVNVLPVQKHDHVLLPAGTVHCSGRGTLVLEVSATPYIFTFKLWDWGRVGLDGLPRPVHLEHGGHNIQMERDTDWVRSQLIHRTQPLGQGDGWREERTGLHELEFIETRRHWFSGPVQHDTAGTVHVLNLVQGREAVVESPDDLFEPFTVHYAETFVVPARVGRYTVRPHGESEGQELATLLAYVRG